mmetsp:Transcript_9451/g.13881  ORF Transcript_9451/g.13881 Transcript_9451/m.13881 type:complete len:348 (-) Transcript_9451:103-1146(-)|eukprot:CAMPEP_0197255226 /NCGR_PEP_ID=MMETSP1429-20130617/71449_1 /TAXON_ID=49237 /ORGANISM="Chaetoceros  sp., Strain UNC1202" /LENGTH=347 /DNA_ID=CAMNT_0042718477 /DNA_START=45 /DNA_END=1088 /DNA_ORIENTATION=+
MNPNKILKSKKAFGAFCVCALYALMVNVNMVQRARILAEKRSLSKVLDGNECTIEPIADVVSVPDDATKTLIASYPGSGKRFAWNVISAMSNHAVADDWDFSETLTKKTMAIKTGWPHKEGVWSWGKWMDQVVLLTRNPRWAIPSYHTMRYELDYSDGWSESYIRIPYTYTERPTVAVWESWRDAHFDTEMERWANYIDFWMSGGKQTVDGKTETHSRCLYSEIECKPKAVIDFDTFYSEHPTSEFFKLSSVLDSTQNVEMIAAAARFCVLDKVFDDKTLHNANRDGAGPVQSAFMFTTAQLKTMLDTTTELRDKYATDPDAVSLVFILNNYINQINSEYMYTVYMS